MAPVASTAGAVYSGPMVQYWLLLLYLFLARPFRRRMVPTVTIYNPQAGFVPSDDRHPGGIGSAQDEAVHVHWTADGRL